MDANIAGFGVVEPILDPIHAEIAIGRGEPAFWKQPPRLRYQLVGHTWKEQLYTRLHHHTGVDVLTVLIPGSGVPGREKAALVDAPIVNDIRGRNALQISNALAKLGIIYWVVIVTNTVIPVQGALLSG
jgi:hypothetical protein